MLYRITDAGRKWIAAIRSHCRPPQAVCIQRSPNTASPGAEIPDFRLNHYEAGTPDNVRHRAARIDRAGYCRGPRRDGLRELSSGHHESTSWTYSPGADFVLIRHPGHDPEKWSPSRSMSNAYRVLEHLRRQGIHIQIDTFAMNNWRVTVPGVAWQEDHHLAPAICKVALDVVRPATKPALD